MKDFKQL